MEKEERFVRVRFLWADWSLLFYFLLLFPFCLRVCSDTRERLGNEQRKKKEKNKNKGQRERKRNAKFNQSMTGTRFNDIRVEGGKESNNYDKPKIILFIFTLYLFELPFRVSYQGWVVYHRDPVLYDMVLCLLCYSCASYFCFYLLFFNFFSMNLAFYSLFRLLFPPAPDSSSNVCKSLFFFPSISHTQLLPLFIQYNRSIDTIRLQLRLQ